MHMPGGPPLQHFVQWAAVYLLIGYIQQPIADPIAQSATTAANQPALMQHPTMPHSFPGDAQALAKAQSPSPSFLWLMALHTLSAPEAHAIACTEPETSNSAAACCLTCMSAASQGSSAMTSRLTMPVAWLPPPSQRHACPEAA